MMFDSIHTNHQFSFLKNDGDKIKRKSPDGKYYNPTVSITVCSPNAATQAGALVPVPSRARAPGVYNVTSILSVPPRWTREDTKLVGDGITVSVTRHRAVSAGTGTPMKS